MSRIGKKPIVIPTGVTIKKEQDTIIVQGSKGTLDIKIHPMVDVETQEKVIKVKRKNDEKESRSLHGLFRALIQNMIIGVEKGFQKKLEIRGVGYKMEVKENDLMLSLGFSHPVRYPIPNGIQIEIDKEIKNTFIIRGINKQLVGQVAAEIRGLKKPEPYKGKGIRYFGEKVQQKAGKAASGGKG
ncbi:50S ribosomal protein L6 [Candidatus Peregrinibacteria bacterium]|nr:50S ribosomal protein L6 [Candidatus Peregrinibacteria bacterium]